MNSSNSSQIDSHDHASCPHAVSLFFTTVMAIITFAAFIGNTLVSVAVYKTPSLRTSTNYYYVNMAISDFLGSLATWPVYFTEEIITSDGSLLHGVFATAGCKIGGFLRLVSYIVSILSLVLIAVDRFIAIVLPLQVTPLPRKIRRALLFATWLTSMAYAFFELYHFEVQKVGEKTTCRFRWNHLAIMTYAIVGIVLFLVAPLIAIIVLYCRIMRALSKAKPEIHTKSGNPLQKRKKQNQSVMKIFKSIVAVFLVCYCLFCIFVILRITLPELFVKDKCHLIKGFSYFVFPLLSSAINPFILFSCSTNFRQVLQALCPRSLRERRSCRAITNVSRGQENVVCLQELEWHARSQMKISMDEAKEELEK